MGNGIVGGVGGFILLTLDLYVALFTADYDRSRASRTSVGSLGVLSRGRNGALLNRAKICVGNSVGFQSSD